MARKVGQIVGRGPHTWLVRVYNGRDPETKKRNYLNHTIRGGLRDAQAHLNKMLGERDRGRNLDSSKQTLNQYLDRRLETYAKPRPRVKSFRDYEGLMRRYVRPRLGTKMLANVPAIDAQALYRELLGRSAEAFNFVAVICGLEAAGDDGEGARGAGCSRQELVCYCAAGEGAGEDSGQPLGPRGVGGHTDHWDVFPRRTANQCLHRLGQARADHHAGGSIPQGLFKEICVAFAEPGIGCGIDAKG